MTSQPLVVATQLAAAFRGPIEARFPRVRFVPVAPGVPRELPPDARVLTRRPLARFVREQDRIDRSYAR